MMAAFNLRSAIALIAIASFSVVRLSDAQDGNSKLQGQKFFAMLEELKIAPDAKDYGDKMTEHIDSVCAAHSSLLQDMTIEKLLTTLEEGTLSDDAKFLLITSWIRVHPEADHDTFKALAAGRGKSFYSPFVGIRLDDGDAMSSGLRFDAIGFPNSTHPFHGLFFAWKIENAVGIEKVVTAGPNRGRSFWYFMTNDRPRSKIYSVRRIERSWAVAK
jgi:hypothetical protein